MDDYCIISVVGSHAGENISDIFERKKEDIKKGNNSFWLFNSWQIKKDIVQKLFLTTKDFIPVYFIEPISKNGCIPTKISQRAVEFYLDNDEKWYPIPFYMSKVTGNIKKNTLALCLNNLELVNEQIFLNVYYDYEKGSPIKIGLGSSTVCAIRYLEKHTKELIVRKVVAKGKLGYPGIVQLR